MFDKQYIIFGIDQNLNLSVFSSFIRKSDDTFFQTIVCDDSYKEKNDYAGILSSTISQYLSNNKCDNCELILSLPNNLIGIDYFVLPNISSSSVSDTFKIAIEERYSNSKDLVVIQDVDVENKKQVLLKTVICQKSLLDSIRKQLKGYKLSQNYTFDAVGTTNAILHLRPKLRKQNFVFVDIKKDFSNLIFVSKDKLKGFAEIQFGENILIKDKVLQEYNITDHNVSELAVLNAKETAKSKKLTSAIDSITEEVDELQTSIGLVDGEKVLIKRNKVYPKYMRRDIPKNDDLIVFENFRIILKQILLYLRSIKNDKKIDKIDTVVINMNVKYAFLIDLINESVDFDITFTLLNNKESDEEVYFNLELYGAMFMKKYNKVMMF